MTTWCRYFVVLFGAMLLSLLVPPCTASPTGLPNRGVQVDPKSTTVTLDGAVKQTFTLPAWPSITPVATIHNIDPKSTTITLDGPVKQTFTLPAWPVVTPITTVRENGAGASPLSTHTAIDWDDRGLVTISDHADKPRVIAVPAWQHHAVQSSHQPLTHTFDKCMNAIYTHPTSPLSILSHSTVSKDINTTTMGSDWIFSALPPSAIIWPSISVWASRYRSDHRVSYSSTRMSFTTITITGGVHSTLTLPAWSEAATPTGTGSAHNPHQTAMGAASSDGIA